MAAVIARSGAEPGAVELARIPGGASRETWMVESEAGRFVLRRDPPGSESLVSQAGEARLIGLAAAAGVPVPEVLAVEPAGGAFGGAGILMAHVAGESLPPRLLRKPEFAAARELLPAQLGAALARIHAVNAAATGLPDPEGDPALAQIAHWERTLDEIGEPLPALEAGLRWLRANAPEPAGPALVHGDFRLGNFIVGEEGLAAVIDWELAHLGYAGE